MSDPPKIQTPLTAAGVDVRGFPIDCCGEYPECSHIYYAVQVWDAAQVEIRRAEATNTRLRETLRNIRDAWDIDSSGNPTFHTAEEAQEIARAALAPDTLRTRDFLAARERAEATNTQLREALAHYASEDHHWHDVTAPPEVNTAGYLTFEYDGGHDYPWEVARAALAQDAEQARD